MESGRNLRRMTSLGRPVALLLACSLLAACSELQYPPPPCGHCVDQSASGAIRTETESAYRQTALSEEPRMQRSLAYARSKPDPVRVDKPSEKAARARLADAQVASRRSVRLPLLAPPEKVEDARRSISGAKTQQSNRQVGYLSRSGTPVLSLVYRAPAQGLSLEMRNHLRILAFDLRRDRALRVELKGSDASRSRDLAWARAMEVHAFLLNEEISPDRIFVQAVDPLDLAGESGRVDVVLTPRPKS